MAATCGRRWASVFAGLAFCLALVCAPPDAAAQMAILEASPSPQRLLRDFPATDGESAVRQLAAHTVMMHAMNVIETWEMGEPGRIAARGRELYQQQRDELAAQHGEAAARRAEELAADPAFVQEVLARYYSPEVVARFAPSAQLMQETDVRNANNVRLLTQALWAVSLVLWALFAWRFMVTLAPARLDVAAMKLHARGRTYDVRRLSGTVAAAKAGVTTETTTTTYSDHSSSSYSRDIHHETIRLADAKGEQHSIYLRDWRMGANPGDEFCLIWLMGGRLKGDYLGVKNFTTREEKTFPYYLTLVLGVQIWTYVLAMFAVFFTAWAVVGEVGPIIGIGGAVATFFLLLIISPILTAPKIKQLSGQFSAVFVRP